MIRKILRRLGFGPGFDYHRFLRPDGVAIWGDLKVELFGPDGELKGSRHVRNKIVTAGLNHVADQLSDQGESAMSHGAIGFGTTGPVAGNTELESEQDRNAFTSKTQSTNTVVYITDFAAGEATGAVTEYGTFNAASAGTMLNRQTFSVINKAADDTLKMTLTLTVSEAT